MLWAGHGLRATIPADEFLGGCGDQLPLLFGASPALGWRDHEATIPATANIEIVAAPCRDLWLQRYMKWAEAMP